MQIQGGTTKTCNNEGTPLINVAVWVSWLTVFASVLLIGQFANLEITAYKIVYSLLHDLLLYYLSLYFSILHRELYYW
jgi:hypothetical protein